MLIKGLRTRAARNVLRSRIEKGILPKPGTLYVPRDERFRLPTIILLGYSVELYRRTKDDWIIRPILLSGSDIIQPTWWSFANSYDMIDTL